MKKTNLVFLLSLILLLTFCSTDRFSIIQDPDYLMEENKKLALRAQKEEIWKEAIYRWKRVIKIKPEDYKAHNNLAVAYEAIGKFELAEREYKTALKLSENNSYIEKNYENFKQHRGNKKKVKSDENFFRKKR